MDWENYFPILNKSSFVVYMDMMQFFKKNIYDAVKS